MSGKLFVAAGMTGGVGGIAILCSEHVLGGLLAALGVLWCTARFVDPGPQL